MRAPSPAAEAAHSLWYKDAIIYELHVRAFHDSNADGIGDIRGLIQKLDYLQDLGVTALWLLPFYPSPLRDDGYDIAGYTQIHPQYGTLREFRQLLREAHRRGLRVITELVLNHTSEAHPWFQRARRAKPGQSARDFYVWNDTPDKYRDARIIFKDFESSNWAWDPKAQSYYWHRFYSHQPDLNFDNPEVRRAMFEVVDFWMQMGVDGMRLDAVPYLFEREGTNCENLSETFGFLQELRAHIDRRFHDRMLLAEANQWPEDAVAYFGDGDVCQMAFHFPLMPRMFMATRMEDRFPVVDILSQTPQIPDSAQWALFLRNHDELTLEMVTDEERDYMYKVYAQDPQARINLGIRRRLAPLLGNDRRLIEMMNGLLFSMPGTPVVYYGDELGMGDNIYLGDRNGVRTPMQWSADRNGGFSKANPQRLYAPVIIDPEYHAESINVESQQANPNSLLWWTKRLIGLRKRHQAFGRGSLEFLYPENRKVLTYLRTYGDERILCVVNLSRHAQYVELDLSRFREMIPVELFGGTEFPKIGELPYFLTLSSHAFYWFSLQAQPEEIQLGTPWEVPSIHVAGSWTDVFDGRVKQQLESALVRYLPTRRWFGGKGRRIKQVQIVDTVPVPEADGGESTAAVLAFLQVEYTEGDPEVDVLPLAAKPIAGEEIKELSALARLTTNEGEVVLFDAVFDRSAALALLDAIAKRRRLPGSSGRLAAVPSRALRRLIREVETLEPQTVQAEQTNTSIVYGERLILKLFRRVEEGLNPDLEIGRFLTERTGFAHVPPVAGAFEFDRGGGEPLTLGILQGFVPNEGDAWKYTQDALQDFVEIALARPEIDPPLPERGRPLDLFQVSPPEIVLETIGTFLESIRLLGRRTAELHLALSSDTEDPNFAPEPLTTFNVRSLYQSMRTHTRQVFRAVRGGGIPGAAGIAEREDEVLDRFDRMLKAKLSTALIRCHGDYHLGQVLWTGKDFVIIDFEGEPARPVSQRRLKRSAVRDVAGMLRSFHYASQVALYGQGGAVRPDGQVRLAPWLRFWHRWVQAAFLGSYLETADGASFVPQGRQELGVLLDAFLLEKAIYELHYEMNNRPDWVAIPIEGITDLLEAT